MRAAVLVSIIGILLTGCDSKAQAPQNPPVSNQTKPDFKVKFTTSKGDFVVAAYRDWAPLGADRFKELVQSGFYDECRFFRVVAGFVVQFGINGNPEVTAKWKSANLQDDPVRQTNTRGMVTFAMAGPNTRTTQIFINYGDNSKLDKDTFAPFGKVIEGMEIVDSFYSGYGEPRGPNQGRIESQGNAYLQDRFKELDYIKTARIIE